MKRVTAPLLTFLCLAVSLHGFGLTATAQRNRLTPEAILKRMAQVYGQCISYQDTGMVEIAYHEATSGRIEKMPFKTYFKRPNLLRFEWTDYNPWAEGRTSIVWSNGKEVFTYWEPDRYEKEETLSLGVAGASGISHGAAHTVPRLLVEEITGFKLTELTNLSLANDEEVEGELCYHIKGKQPFSDSIYDLWVSKRDFLLRKVRNQSKYDNYYTIQEEVRRNIRINQPIASAVFNFKPPIPLSERKETELGIPLLLDEKPNWTEFVSEEGAFKVLLPGKPTKQTITVNTPKGQIVHNSFMAASGGVICIINYAELPAVVTAPNEIKAIFDEARNEFVKAMEGKLVSEKNISFEGTQGREFEVETRSAKAKGRFYLINQRFYQMVIMDASLSGKSPGAEPDKFLDSFKIIPDTKGIAALFQRKDYGLASSAGLRR